MTRASVTAFCSVLLGSIATAACNIAGPSCVSRQERGTVAVVEGEVPAGATVAHIVDYGTQGSQNDVQVSWPAQSAADGPRIAIYATRAECSALTLPSPPREDACAVLGIAGAVDGRLATSLTVTHGRGNPEILGAPPRFKLWVVGDVKQSTSYRLHVTFFYGPDC